MGELKPLLVERFLSLEFKIKILKYKVIYQKQINLETDE